MKTKAPSKKVAKTKKKKLTPLPKLKSKLWALFSTFIRLRDSDTEGNIRCCTTGNVYHWTKSQAGHYHSQRGNPALIFCEQNVHAQSPIANKLQRNNITWDYTEFMLNKYGLDEMRAMASLRGVPFKFERKWLEDKIVEYTEKVNLLKQEKGIK